MTNEPKVRAEVIDLNKKWGRHYADICKYAVVIRSDLDKVDYVYTCENVCKELAELIAAKINAPDPIAVIGEMIAKYERNEGNEKYDDGYLLGLAEAIDQLRTIEILKQVGGGV